MDWITDEIAIGNYLDARNADLLQREGVRSILSLDGSLSSENATWLGVSHVIPILLLDDEGNDRRVFSSAIDHLERLLLNDGPVLVHCHAGRSRSAAVVAGYLMRTRGMNVRDALAFIAYRRAVNLTPGVKRMLDKLETD